MISAYAQHGEANNALKTFELLIQAGINPDEVTFVTLLSATVELNEDEIGKWIHSHIINTGMNFTLKLYNSFINMYAKCGDIVSSVELFNIMQEQHITMDLVTW